MEVYRLQNNGALQPQRSLHLGNRFVLPQSAMEIQRTERAAEHPVEVKRALQMVDLVLQDAAYHPEASITCGAPVSSRHSTRTSRARGTMAVYPGKLRHPSKNSTSAGDWT